MALNRRDVTRFLGGRAATVASGLRARMTEAGAFAPQDAAGRAVWARVWAVIDALPRPAMAVASLAVIAPAVVAPDWLATRIAVLATLPEAVWWLAGAGLGLGFGAGFQRREQDFARELMDRNPPPDPLSTAATGTDAALAQHAEGPGTNAALAEWRAGQGRNPG
ncbi:MAG: hypothetical protein IT542_09990 [Rubellimicrobium sp.]|nr:hypothetical protein [Rubellimicrobium sp.]